MIIKYDWNHGGEDQALYLFHRNDLPPLVDTAVGAHVMGKPGFTALGTAYHIHRGQAVMGPAFSLSGFGMPLGWVCHDSSLFPLV